LHDEAKSLVTAKFFPAVLSLLFLVLLSVSLLEKGGENTKQITGVNLRIAFIVSVLKV